MVQQDMVQQDITSINGVQDVQSLDRSERFKGYTLFTDITDRRIRCHNQGTMLANIYEDHCAGGVINKIGAMTVLGYMGCVDQKDRRIVKDAYDKTLLDRGFTSIPVKGV